MEQVSYQNRLQSIHGAMIFNFYPANITSSYPIGEITLERFLESIKSPKPHIVKIFEQIKIAEECGDMAEKNKLKTSLYSFTPCVYVKGSRKYNNIQNWTGLMCLDFDHLEIESAKEFKQALFDEYKFIIATWLSPSRHGVIALVKIPVVHSVGEFKEYFNALERTLSIYKGWDHAPNNCILPLFLSYDYELLYREDATEWTERYVKPIPPPIKQYAVTDKTNNIEAIILSSINKITDAGHPILRATAYALGGYCSAGYIKKDYAITMIEKMIRSNSYLSKKPEVYIKTAIQMINKGESQPLYLK